MLITKIKRVIRSGFIGFWRNGLVSLSAVLVMLVTLLVIGSLIFGQAVLDTALAYVKDKVDINVYFTLDAKDSDISALRDLLASRPEVLSVEYTSRDEALEAFKEKHKNSPQTLGALAELGENPLGAHITVKAKDPSQYEAIARLLQPENATALSAESSAFNSSSIDKVTYFEKKSIIDRLSLIIDSTQKVGLAISIALCFMAILVTFNTIRLIIYTAREEIAVMKLVGASNNYVRGPFIVEGIMCGTIASLLAMGVFFAFTAYIGTESERFFGGLNLYSYYKENFLQIFGIIFSIGILLATLSSYLAVRRYLRV